jgi:heterodisulfide reductase subunit A-like polyferredoxin
MAVVGIVRKQRVAWSIASGLGQAIALGGVSLASAIGRGEQVRDALPFTALLAAVVLVVGGGAAYLAATLRDRP